MLRPEVYGKNHYRWSQEKILNKDGYVKLRVGRSHPLADSNGYAYEHLVVWCAAANPRPDRGHLIHHKNEDKQDNRIENLELITRSEHNRLHNAQKTRDLGSGRFVGKKAASRLLDGNVWDQMPEVRP